MFCLVKIYTNGYKEKFFQGFSQLASIHDFRFLQFQPELLTSNIINCQHFDYSAVVFFRAHHTTLEYKVT